MWNKERDKRRFRYNNPAPDSINKKENKDILKTPLYFQ
jgi:hypothetical protein